MKKNYLDPSIDLQTEIGNQLYNALQGDVVLPLAVIGEDAKCVQQLHDQLEGDSLKVTKNTIRDIYDAFMEVKETLGFDENVDLFIVNNAEVNASSRMSYNEQYPHVIQLLSPLVKLLSRDELKFVIGHEMGHIINRDTTIRAIHNFIYRDEKEDAEPEYIRLRKNLYDLLCELSADRYGYIACGDIDASVSALYKITSGLDLGQYKIKISSLMKENEERLKLFMEDDGEMFGDHPVLPVRVHALNVYANAKSQEHLDEEMLNIYHLYYRGSELSELFIQFVAIAGLYIANLDGNMTNEEREQILRRIGDNDLFPSEILKEIEETGNIDKKFKEIVEQLKDVPDMRARMIMYFVEVALADKELSKTEFDAAFEFGNQLGFSNEEIANYIGSVIRDTCIPKVL